MKFYRILALCLLCAMLLCAGGCSKKPGADESSMSSKAPSSAPESVSSQEGKKPVSSKAPASSADESSVSSENPGEEEEKKNEYLPETDTGDEQFKKAFAGNAIDLQFEQEYSSATSGTLLIAACSDATERWKSFVDSAYEEVLALASEADAQSIRASQEEWNQSGDQRLAEIREQAIAEGGALKAARAVMLFYRERAAELCYLHYTLAGDLPDFPEITPEGGAMG